MSYGVNDGPQGHDHPCGPWEHTCHLPTDDGECMACGARDCPDGEPLHYHHDGCPCCSQRAQRDPRIQELRAMVLKLRQQYEAIVPGDAADAALQRDLVLQTKRVDAQLEEWQDAIARGEEGQ